MSVCPNCKKKLRFYHIGQYCPHCKVNLRFFGFEEKFLREAKEAELGFAGVKIKIKHFKAAFVGSKLTVARLCLLALPLLSLLIPSGTAQIKLPFYEETVSFSALGVFSSFTGGGLDFIGKMANSEIAGEVFAALQRAMSSLLGVTVCAVLCLLFTILCFISLKKMAKLLCIVSVLGTVGCVVTAYFINRFHAIALSFDSVLISGSRSFGLAFTVVAFAVVFTLNFLIVKNGVPVEYAEGELERYEIAKKVKAGEINIDDLPQPVVETAETREIEEKIRKEREAYEKKSAEKEAESAQEVQS